MTVDVGVSCCWSLTPRCAALLAAWAPRPGCDVPLQPYRWLGVAVARHLLLFVRLRPSVRHLSLRCNVGAAFPRGHMKLQRAGKCHIGCCRAWRGVAGRGGAWWGLVAHTTARRAHFAAETFRSVPRSKSSIFRHFYRPSPVDSAGSAPPSGILPFCLKSISNRSLL